MKVRWISDPGYAQAEAPEQIGDVRVVQYRDLLVSTGGIKDGEQRAVDLPKSNVLSYQLEDGSQILVRPSGTGKIKFYFEVCENCRQLIRLRRFDSGTSVS